MADNVTEFTDDNFEAEVLKSDKPVLVDFWAEWCSPCRMLAPYIEQFATEFGDKVKVGKLDVENNQSIAGRFNIRSIPTVVLFKNGQPAETIVGLRPNDIKVALEAV